MLWEFLQSFAEFCIREYLLKNPVKKKLNLRLETVLEEARKQMTEKIINYINIFNKK